MTFRQLLGGRLKVEFLVYYCPKKFFNCEQGR